MKELLERWIELLSQSGSNTKNQVLEEMQKCLDELPTILYICDTRQCENGHCHTCHHTTNIKHARNFKQLIKNDFIEDDGFERLEQIINELKEELNNVTGKRNEKC